MKNLMIVFGLTLALPNAQAGALYGNQFIRLDVDQSEVAFYVPQGACKLSIMANITSLNTGSKEAKALTEDLEIMGATFIYEEGYLVLQTEDFICSLPSFGGRIRIRTKDGRTLKEAIRSIIPSRANEESNLIVL